MEIEKSNMGNVKATIDPTFHLRTAKLEDESAKYIEYRRKWKENPEKYIVEDSPIHLDLESITNCNLKCFMCFQSYDPPQPAAMELSLFKKIVDEGAEKGLCSIKTQYRGEPLLDTRMVEMVRYAKERGIVEVMFNTNATLLTEEKSRELIEAGLDKLICSVDGYTKEVYEQIRIGAKFERVLKNIKNMQRIKKELGSEKPIVRVQMVDTPKNHHQIDEYLKFWGEIAEQLAIEDMLDWEAKEEDNTVLKDFACAQLWQRLIVLADGDVLPCCRATRGGNEKLEVLGNAYEDSIENLWKGDRMTRLRALHQEGNSHRIKMCRACGLRKLLISQNGKGVG